LLLGLPTKPRCGWGGATVARHHEAIFPQANGGFSGANGGGGLAQGNVGTGLPQANGGKGVVHGIGGRGYSHETGGPAQGSSGVCVAVDAGMGSAEGDDSGTEDGVSDCDEDAPPAKRLALWDRQPPARDATAGSRIWPCMSAHAPAVLSTTGDPPRAAGHPAVSGADGHPAVSGECRRPECVSGASSDPDALPPSLRQPASICPAAMSKLPYHKLLVRVRGYYQWGFPFGRELDRASNCSSRAPPPPAGAERGKCGYPGCVRPEKHSGPHELVAIEGKRRREPTKLARDLGA